MLVGQTNTAGGKNKVEQPKWTGAASFLPVFFLAISFVFFRGFLHWPKINEVYFT